MTTFGEICEAIKKTDNNFEFVNILGIHEFIIEERVTRKGKYKVTLSFNAKEMLKNPECIPSKRSDFIYEPLLLFIKQNWDKIEQGEKKDEQEKS